MNKQKILIPVILALSVVLLSACTIKQPPGKNIGDFTFTDQNNEAFGSDELSDKIWIADFVFTDCETVCPPMTMEMAILQNEFIKRGIDAQFVSFTVDPITDTPSALKTYIKQYTDNETNWHLLTGYSQNEIEQFAREKFQTIVQKPENSTQVIHGTSFYLIDKDGYKFNEYNFVDPTYIDTLISDIKKIN